MTAPLKLFVVGENSGNPDDWSIWSEWSLVLAENAEHVRSISGKPGPVTEVDVSKPCVLVSMPEPAWGEDI